MDNMELLPSDIKVVTDYLNHLDDYFLYAIFYNDVKCEHSLLPVETMTICSILDKMKYEKIIGFLKIIA